MWAKRTSKNHAFTVVELLIVVVVIAILATIVVVAYRGVQRSAARSLATDTIKKANQALKVEGVFNQGAPATLPANFKSPDSVSIVLSSGGESYSGLSTIQNGVLFQKVCTDLIASPQYSTIHAREGGGTSSVVMKCDDNISANSLLITGWDSKTWTVPVTKATLQAYIDSVPYDSWWTDRQTVVRGFYSELIAQHTARGGSWPVASFWDPWANQWSGVQKQDLPAPNSANPNSYCLSATHLTYTDIVYHVSGSGGAIEQGAC